MGLRRDMRAKNPAHPGWFVKRDVVAAMGLSVDRAAAARGVAHPLPSKPPEERAILSAELAPGTETVLDVSMDTLPRMRTACDVARIREREIDLVASKWRVA